MMNVKLSAAALALILAAVPAEAAVVSIAQGISVFGDLAFDDTAKQNISLPTFDPSLGTLLSTSIRAYGVLDWGEPYITGAYPGPLETVTSAGSLIVFDEDFNVLATQNRQGPTFRVPYTTGASGALSFNVAGTLPAGDDSTFINLNLYAYAICTACVVFDTDDTGGTFNGTLITTFQYIPAAGIPEPTSWSLLGMELLGLGAASRRQPIPK